ncbi:MAG: hypothetical protein M1816_001653 [Peltula sp. TS41687]|nr:MAG: hypothetical protein M1816_001653 [Peltula sp. TS41687]
MASWLVNTPDEKVVSELCGCYGPKRIDGYVAGEQALEEPRQAKVTTDRAISEADGRLNQATSSRAEELHRKILVFSISHDHTMVNIYGHDPWIEGDRVTFHRHLIRSFSLMEQDGKERWSAYRFVWKLYDHFVPLHLARIQSAIAQLPKPTSESFMSIVSTGTESELLDSQDMGESVSSSQDTVPSKKSRTSVTVLLRQQLERLQGELKERDQQIERQRQESKQEIEGLKEQLTQQTGLLRNISSLMEGERGT